jgi:hypothetical protein
MIVGNFPNVRKNSYGNFAFSADLRGPGWARIPKGLKFINNATGSRGHGVLHEISALGHRVNWRRRTAVCLLFLLLLYYEVYRWLPLGKWNWQFRWPVQNDQFYPDIAIGLLLTFFLAAFIRAWRAGTWVSVFLLGLWGCVHFFDWWLPYLQSSASNYPRFSFYALHTQVLPVIGNHYPPDGGHAVLDLILYPTWLTCLLAAISQDH